MAINRDGTGNTNLHVTGFELDDKNSVPTRIQVMDKDGYLRWLACTDVDEAGIPVLHIEYPGVYGFQGGRIEASYSGVMQIEPLEITDPNQVIDVPSDIKYDPITVNIPVDTQTLSLTLIPSDGTISPDEGYIGFDEVTVNIPKASIELTSSTGTSGNVDPYRNSTYYYSKFYYLNTRRYYRTVTMLSPISLIKRGGPSMTIWKSGVNGSLFRLTYYRKAGSCESYIACSESERSNLTNRLYIHPGWFPVGGGTRQYLTDIFDYVNYGMDSAKNQPYGLSAMIDLSTAGPTLLGSIFNIPSERTYTLAQSFFFSDVTWANQDFFNQPAYVNWTHETVIHLSITLASDEDTLYNGFIKNWPDLLLVDIGRNVRDIKTSAIDYCPKLTAVTFLHQSGDDLPTIANGGIYDRSSSIRHVFFRAEKLEEARTKYASKPWAQYIEEIPTSWYYLPPGLTNSDFGGYLDLPEFRIGSN